MYYYDTNLNHLSTYFFFFFIFAVSNETGESSLEIRRSILTSHAIDIEIHLRERNPNFKKVRNSPYKHLYLTSQNINPTIRNIGIQKIHDKIQN